MENRYILHISHFIFVDAELVCRIHFCDFGGRKEFICQAYEEHSLNFHEFDMSLNDERVQRSEGIQNRSCQQI